MTIITRLLPILLISMLPSGCFQLGTESQGNVSASAKLKAPIDYLLGTGETRSIQEVSANLGGQVAHNLTSSSLVDSRVTIQPGSLSISSRIVVEPGTSLSDSNMLSEAALPSDISVVSSSTALIVRPTSAVDLRSPMTISIPLPVSLSQLHLASSAGSKYVIFFKWLDPATNKLMVVVRPVDGKEVVLKYDESSHKDVIEFKGYFGAFWAATLNREVTVAELPSEKTSEEPIVNASKVQVMAPGGIVEEVSVVKSEAIPVIAWPKTSIAFSQASRSIRLSAELPPGHSVNNCRAQFLESSSPLSPVAVDAPLGVIHVWPVPSSLAASYTGRFRCYDEMNRLTLTPWSDKITIAGQTSVGGGGDIPPPQTGSGPIDAPPPVVPPAPLPLSLDCASTPSLEIQSIENGVPASYATLNRVSGCLYKKTQIRVTTNASFYVTAAAQSIACGNSTAATVVDNVSGRCELSPPGTHPGFPFYLERGTYDLSINFGGSTSIPGTSLTRTSCGFGELKAYFSLALANLYDLGSSHTMVHYGACEYEFVSPTAPIPGNGYMGIKGPPLANSPTENLSCGDQFSSNGDSPAMHFVNLFMTNICSNSLVTEIGRYFSIQAPYTSAVHSLSVKYGAAAQEAAQSQGVLSGVVNAVEYRAETQCPSFIQLVTYSGGLTTVHSSIGRANSCVYRLPAEVASGDQFFVKDPVRSLYCGQGGDSLSLTCSSDIMTLMPLNLSGFTPDLYEVIISGLANLGSLTTIAVNPVIPDCKGGLYQHASLGAGYQPSLDKAFKEVAKCRFEKTWTPNISDDRFMIASGMGNLFCANQPGFNYPIVADASPMNMVCAPSISEAISYSLVAIDGVTLNQAYKISVDARYKSFGFVKTRVLPVSPSMDVCGATMTINGGLPSGGSIVAHPVKGCLASFTQQFPDNYPTTYTASIVSMTFDEDVAGSTYSTAMSFPVNGQAISPTTAFTQIDLQACSPCSSKNLSLPEPLAGRTLRYDVKITPSQNPGVAPQVRVIVRDITAYKTDVLWRLLAVHADGGIQIIPGIADGVAPYHKLSYSYGSSGMVDDFYIAKDMDSYCARDSLIDTQNVAMACGFLAVASRTPAFSLAVPSATSQGFLLMQRTIEDKPVLTKPNP
ncbi:MAG: hypothetical protein EOP06_02010 [Proteobacteria bacterium]|nr:MAG: hypothetical protein EOP06_02010 [Pseudomonadota bacterium]